VSGQASRLNGRKGGRPKGRRSQATLDKEAAREFVRQTITKALGPLITSQLANAQGLKYLVTRDKKTGKFIRVGEAMARQSGEETIEVWEKDPSVQAFTDLLNRALDKPKEQEQTIAVTGPDGGPVVYTWQE
jgi:hypothetical protein